MSVSKYRVEIPFGHVSQYTPSGDFNINFDMGTGEITPGGSHPLSNIHLNPQTLQDVQRWGIDEIDETTRRDLAEATAAERQMPRIIGASIVDMRRLAQAEF